jgi:uncharacterized protein YecE (DUF72 family)
MKPVRIGCSGWMYDDWRGGLYPERVPKRRWLEIYASVFDTVEVNATFYRLARRDAVAGWVEQTPPGFLFAVKASRYLTHIRRLRDPAEPVQRLMHAAAGLGGRLGPVLLQLPPNLPADAGALDECLGEFSRFPGVRVAVEFRHESWWADDIRELLTRRNAALCWADRLGRPITALWRTADWGYLRLHEGRARPWPRYGRQALRSWVQRIGTTWPAAADVFVYFNNDQGGAAVGDAAAFAALARAAGRPVARAGLPGADAGHRV